MLTQTQSGCGERVRRVLNLFSTHHVDRTWPQLAAPVAAVALLYVAAGVGMAYVAGFGVVHRRLVDAEWWWLAPSFGAVVLAFCGYYFAYRGIKWVEGGPELDTPALLAVVAAGFGGFLAQGGTALDEFAMRAGGASKREAKVRVGALAGFEHGVLAIIVCPAAIAALVAGVVIPRQDFTWPWAIIPGPAFVLFIGWRSATATASTTVPAGANAWACSSIPRTSCTRCCDAHAGTRSR